MGRTIGAVVGTALALLALSGAAHNPALAQASKKAPAKAAAPKSDEEAGAQAMKAYDAGVRAWQSGKPDGAVENLNAAIAAGKLPQQQMARALYYRGLAYRKQGKPALAISDLQSALWLKGALSEAERNEALSARAAAYKEAGVADPQAGKVSESANRIGEAVKTAAAPAGPAAAPASAQPAAAPPQAAASAQPADWKTTAVRGAPKTASIANGGAAGAAAPAPAPVQPAAAPVAQAEAPKSQGSSGSFLSSMFGFGGSQKSAADEVPRRVPPPPRVDEDPDKPKPWGTAQVRPAGASRVAAAAPSTTGSTTPGSAQQAAAAPAGAFRLQVAAAPTRAEAEKIVTKLKKEQPKAVAQRSVDIAEAGNVFRVRLGPYATVNEPRNLCVKLRQTGYDCMIVTQ